MAQDSPLAKPLRKFDRNKDGKLTGEEFVAARQAHNRGGKELEYGPRRIEEFMERRRNSWFSTHTALLDTNKDGSLDEAEKAKAEKVWAEIAQDAEKIRRDITRKYDKNDDGELTGQERDASRREFDQLRTESEKRIMGASFRKVELPKPPAS
jgi:hypothetical protein